MELIRDNKIDEFLYDYQMDKFKFTREMLILALQYRHFQIAEIMFKSGLGCFKSEIYFDTFPENIQELITNYEELYKNKELPIKDLYEIVPYIENTKRKLDDQLRDVHDQIFNRKYNALYLNRKIKEYQQVPIQVVKQLYNGEETEYGKMTNYKINWFTWGFYDGDNSNETFIDFTGKDDVHDSNQYLSQPTPVELFGNFDVCYHSDFETKQDIYDTDNTKWICIRHLLPPIIKGDAPECNYDACNNSNQSDCERHGVLDNLNIYYYNRYKFDYTSNGHNKFIHDCMANTLPQFRDRYVIMYIFVK